MSDFIGSTSARTPWHLWVVGVIALLWNAFGCFDYIMTETRNEAYLSSFSEEQLAYFFSLPLWYVAFWAIGVWSALAASVCLLLRKKWALWLFALSLLGMAVTFTASILSAEAREVMGSATLGISAVIWIIGLFEIWYAWTMTGRGVLR